LETGAIQSCKKEIQNNRIKTISLREAFENATDLKLSEIALDIEYIQLETNKSSALGDNLRTYVNDDYIIAVMLDQL
jgi:deoxycytidylate deaminase